MPWHTLLVPGFTNYVLPSLFHWFYSSRPCPRSEGQGGCCILWGVRGHSTQTRWGWPVVTGPPRSAPPYFSQLWRHFPECCQPRASRWTLSLLGGGKHSACVVVYAGGLFLFPCSQLSIALLVLLWPQRRTDGWGCRQQKASHAQAHYCGL